MDINSLLSPSETPRANSLTPRASAQSPFRHVQRTHSGSAKPAPNASPLMRTIQPPSSIPAHIRSPSQAPSHSSPLISPVPAGTLTTSQYPQTSSAQSMETLADLASIPNQQPTSSTPPLLSSRESYESQVSNAIHRTQITSNPRASFDIAMVDTPKQLLRGDFSGTSLPLEIQQRLGELVGCVQETASAYDSHIEIIKILHQGFVDHIYPSSSPNARRDPRTYDLLGELRQARENMEKLFAVGEEQWLDWLQDESILAQTAEERVTVVEKCRRAVEEEYGSSKLWSTYAEWVLHCHTWASSDSTENSQDGTPDPERLIGQELFKWDGVLQVWEEAVEQTRDDMANGHLVWDKYAQARFPKLDQKLPQESASQAMQLFKQRLLAPHSTWDQTFQTFSSFVSANFSNEEYENIMGDTLREAAHAKSVWAAREQYEFAVAEAGKAGDKYSEYQAFMAYIEWEKAQEAQTNSKKGKGKRKEAASQKISDLDLVKSLFQRAELRIPSVSSIWDEHIEYMIEKRKSGLLDVLFRATKHCPWSGSLWKQYLLASEVADVPYQETETIKHNATKTGMLDAAGIEDVLRVHDAWCGYLLRRTRRPDATEEDADVAEMGIRTSMETVQSLASKLGLTADFDTFFRLQRKYIEYLKGQGRLDNARKQFDDAIPVYGKHYRFWLRFYEFEMQKSIHINSLQQDARDGVSSISSAPFAVAILKQGLEQSNVDYPEYLIEALLNHCEDYEDAEELQNGLSLVAKVQKVITLKREIETERAAEVVAQPQSQAAIEERAEAVANGLHIGKRKRNESPNHEDQSNKRVRSEETSAGSVEPALSTDEALKRDREHASILVQNLPPKISETRVRQYFSNCGTVQSLKKIQDAEHSVIVEFRDAEEAQYALSRDGQDLDGAILSVLLNSGSTVYVTNYPAAADEAYLRDLFNAYGEVINVRLPSLQGNKRRRFCYIEYKSSDQAQAALELDGREIEGLEIVVKISNPAIRQVRSERKSEGRTIFIGQLPFKATEEDVRAEFSKFGEVETLKMPHDPNAKQRNKGIAFLTFANEAAANDAITMDGQTFQGRNIKVEIISSGHQGHSKDAASNDKSMSPTPHLNGSARSPSAPPSTKHLSPELLEERRQRTIAISDVPDTVNESRIRAMAEKIGPVRKVILKTNHQGALIEYDTAIDAGKGAIELDGLEIDPGRKIRVTSQQEMLRQQPEKKVEKVGKPSHPKAAANAPVKRPVQPGARRGGHLGQRKAGVFNGGSVVQQNGEGKIAKKSNDDFRAMIKKI